MLGRGTLRKGALWQSVFHLELASGRRCCPESVAQLLACEQMSRMQRAALLRHGAKQTHAARQDPLAATERSQYILI